MLVSLHLEPEIYEKLHSLSDMTGASPGQIIEILIGQFLKNVR